jgi:hypothetical protein
MHAKLLRQEQPRPQREGRAAPQKGRLPALREPGQDFIGVLQQIFTGEQIQFHIQRIPKNAPESKEGEPARSL